MDDFPTLDLDMQATELPEPITRWGSIGRTRPMSGTYHMYEDDWKFNALDTYPDRLAAVGCKVAVEPNYSTWPAMGEAAARETIRRKRSIAAKWQATGVRVIVDLNVDPAFRHIALLGVPAGWRAYAVRHQAGIGLDEIEADFRAACDRAGTDTGLLFAVFGGWKKVRDLCAERKWTWIGEDLHRARGSTDGTRAWE